MAGKVKVPTELERAQSEIESLKRAHQINITMIAEKNMKLDSYERESEIRTREIQFLRQVIQHQIETINKLSEAIRTRS